ncbi:MAG: nucleotidyltransferase domain-containing protein [Candidatus Dormibacteria bacterium]
MAAGEHTVGMQGTAPDDVASFVRNLAHRLAAAGPGLVGVYLHGSAVLGDFEAEASDVDILVVVQDGIAESSVQVLARIVAAQVVTPGSGLEVSVVEESSCRRPSPPWPYKVHITTSSVETRTTWPEPGAGDSDLSLHYAVTRQAGWAAYGPLPTDVVGEVGRHLVAAQLAGELLWAVDHASESYAVLNTCRALRWSAEGTFCSKTAGGTWALSRDLEPALVEKALAARRTHRNTAAGPKAGAFARQVAALLQVGQAN